MLLGRLNLQDNMIVASGSLSHKIAAMKRLSDGKVPCVSYRNMSVEGKLWVIGNCRCLGEGTRGHIWLVRKQLQGEMAERSKAPD